MSLDQSPIPGSDKTALRNHLKAVLKGLSASEKESAGQEICQIIKENPLWKASQTVLGYVPVADEPHIYGLLQNALDTGKTLLLPAFEEKIGVYSARKVTNLNQDLVPGRFGIMEPAPFCAPGLLMQLDLSLVPGVGFDLNGCRLGRGNGYYDRLLSEASGLKCGLAFECQLTADIPREPHDIQMNWVVLPSRWLACYHATRGF
jgi:5-formyltetrahydrofolate cyclo-ligase